MTPGSLFPLQAGRAEYKYVRGKRKIIRHLNDGWYPNGIRWSFPLGFWSFMFRQVECELSDEEKEQQAMAQLQFEEGAKRSERSLMRSEELLEKMAQMMKLDDEGVE